MSVLLRFGHDLQSAEHVSEKDHWDDASEDHVSGEDASSDLQCGRDRVEDNEQEEQHLQRARGTRGNTQVLDLGRSYLESYLNVFPTFLQIQDQVGYLPFL